MTFDNLHSAGVKAAVLAWRSTVGNSFACMEAAIAAYQEITSPPLSAENAFDSGEIIPEIE